MLTLGFCPLEAILNSDICKNNILRPSKPKPHSFYRGYSWTGTSPLVGQFKKLRTSTGIRVKDPILIMNRRPESRFWLANRLAIKTLSFMKNVGTVKTGFRIRSSMKGFKIWEKSPDKKIEISTMTVCELKNSL